MTTSPTDSEKLDFIYQWAKAHPLPLSEPKPDLPFEVAEADAGIMSWNDAMKKFDGSEKSERWRLPTKEELDLIYKNKGMFKGLDLTGSLPAGWYWSGTPGYGSHAYDQRFSDGLQLDDFRYLDSSVRCVR
jgi:hypothetical protein